MNDRRGGHPQLQPLRAANQVRSSTTMSAGPFPPVGHTIVVIARWTSPDRCHKCGSITFQFGSAALSSPGGLALVFFKLFVYCR